MSVQMALPGWALNDGRFTFDRFSRRSRSTTTKIPGLRRNCGSDPSWTFSFRNYKLKIV